jgi:hypothetical protein
MYFNPTDQLTANNHAASDKIIYAKKRSYGMTAKGDGNL